MRTIEASEFEAKCLSLIDEVARTGDSIRIIKRGKPVAELRPIRGPRIASPFGLHEGCVSITGDIMTPIDQESWEALARPAPPR